MQVLANNGNAVVLDERLQEHLKIKAAPEFIVYSQLLVQLHLPAEKWTYDKLNKGFLHLQCIDELEELDSIRFKQLEMGLLASPLRLYTYYLLQSFLGNGLNYSGLGILPGKRNHFVFLNTGFELDKMNQDQFQLNSISRFVMQRTKKAELLKIHEAFFVLMDQKLKSKLLNALTLFQSETGQQVDKVKFVDKVLDQKRLDRLNVFSIKQIARL